MWCVVALVSELRASLLESSIRTKLDLVPLKQMFERACSVFPSNLCKAQLCRSVAELSELRKSKSELYTLELFKV